MQVYPSDTIGTFSLTITGSGGGITRSASFQINLKNNSSIFLSLSSNEIINGQSTILSGKIIPNPGIANVVLQLNENVWGNLTKMSTDSNGTFSYQWMPTSSGTYSLRALWDGDQNYFGSISYVQTLTVEPKSGTVTTELTLGAALVSVVVIFFLMLRRVKTKPKIT